MDFDQTAKSVIRGHSRIGDAECSIAYDDSIDSTAYIFCFCLSLSRSHGSPFSSPDYDLIDRILRKSAQRLSVLSSIYGENAQYTTLFIANVEKAS